MIPEFKKDFFVTASRYARVHKHTKIEKVLKQQPTIKKRLPDGKSRPKNYVPPKIAKHIKPEVHKITLAELKKEKTKNQQLKEIEKQLRVLEIFYKQLKKKDCPKKEINKVKTKIQKIKTLIKIKKQKT